MRDKKLILKVILASFFHFIHFLLERMSESLFYESLPLAKQRFSPLKKEGESPSFIKRDLGRLC